MGMGWGWDGMGWGWDGDGISPGQLEDEGGGRDEECEDEEPRECGVDVAVAQRALRGQVCPQKVIHLRGARHLREEARCERMRGVNACTV